MTAASQGAVLTLALTCFGMIGGAQTSPPGAADVLIATTFTTPLTYREAIERLDSYYDEQVGRKGEIAFPQIAPYRHFEVWHEMWAFFESPENHTRVTLKRQSDAGTARVTKSSMLDLAGRLNAELPLTFQEEAGLRTVAGEIYSTRKDLAAALAGQPALRPLVSWLHSGLFASADPLTKISLSPAGLHGVRQLIVTTVDLQSARSLMAKLQQGAAVAGVCAAFSEEVELDAELHDAAQNRNDTLANGGAPTLYHPQMDLKYIEGRLRSDPAMQRRIAAAKGSYDVRFRVDRPFRKVTVAWSQVAGYSVATGAIEGATELGQTAVPNVRKMPPGTPPMTARVHLEPLKAGLFRVRLSGEGMEGEAVAIDERVFKFDGKTFEELQNLGQ